MGNGKSQQNCKEYRYLFVGGTREDKLQVLKEVVNEFSAVQYNKQKLRVEAVRIKQYMMRGILTLMHAYRREFKSEEEDSKDRTSEFEVAMRMLSELGDIASVEFDSNSSAGGNASISQMREIEAVLSNDARMPVMLKAVWMKEEIQMLYQIESRSVESHLVEFADLFLNRIDEIFTAGWIPSRFDIACASQTKRKSFEWKLIHKGLHVTCVATLSNAHRSSHIIDEEMFDFEDEETGDDFHGVVYVYRMDQFDVEVSPTMKSLVFALKLWSEVITRVCTDHRLVLVLTCKDLFEEKLKHGSSLKSVFPEYSGDDEYQPCFDYIVGQFENARDTDLNSTSLFVQDLNSTTNTRPDKKFLFQSIKQGIFETNFSGVGLMNQPTTTEEDLGRFVSDE